jgi:hypothetical protein
MNKRRSDGATDVYLEAGSRRAFACALEWPGWCRSGKDEQQALENLAAFAARYAAVCKHAGLAPPDAAEGFKVVERITGSTSTDFGVPERAAKGDSRPLNSGDAKQLAALVEASWKTFDEVLATAPATLRKGPRGGGRDRDAIAQHVVGAEATMYARKLGIRQKEPAHDDVSAVAALRSEILAVLRDARGPALVEKGWLPRYAARRIAWHVLDHAWEIEDKSE